MRAAYKFVLETCLVHWQPRWDHLKSAHTSNFKKCEIFSNLLLCKNVNAKKCPCGLKVFDLNGQKNRGTFGFM